jgi:hypothetical protein
MKQKLISALIFAVTLSLMLSSLVRAYVGTDQSDYQPGSVVTITGDNRDGAGFLPGESIRVEVWGPNGFQVTSEPSNPTADANGAWSWQFRLWDSEDAGGEYTYTASGLTSQVSQSGTFTDATGLYLYQILQGSIGPNTGVSGSTITAYASLQSCYYSYSTRKCTPWAPVVGKQLTFAFTNDPMVDPRNWVISNPTDSNGRATATMEVPAGPAWLWARYVIGPISNYAMNNIEFTVTQPVSITTTTVTVNDATYDGSPHGGTAVVTDSLGLNQSLEVSYSGRNGTNYGPSTTAPTNAGDYLASASYAGDANHLPSSDSRTYTITKAASTTTVVVLGGENFTYDGNEHSATVTVIGAGGLNLTLAPEYSCGHVPKDAADTGCVASYTFDGDANHLSSSDSKTYTIAKAASTTTVIVTGGENFTYDGNEHPATVTVIGAGGLNLTPAPEYSCGHVPKDAADTGCVASYTFDGDANHLASSDSKTYAIAKAVATCTITGYSVIYDGNPKFATDLCTGVKDESLGGLDLNGTKHTDAGNYTDIWTFTDVTGNYNNASNTVKDIIAKAKLTVTADNKSITFGDPLPIFTFKYSGFVNGENENVIHTAPTCNAGPITKYGNYSIVCTGGVDDNYDFNYVNGTLTVGAWMLKGFYNPVDMNGVWNTVKSGSTVPLKFELFAAGTELTNVSAVKSITAAQVACLGGAEDAIEEVVSTTGGTVLRYDTTGGQFIDNWKTPRNSGNCYRVTMTSVDGSRLEAYFKLK